MVLPGSKQILRLINVHTDHAGEIARMLEVKQLLSELGDPGEDVLIYTGDFNATSEAPEIRYMTEARPELGLRDATSELGGTFHDFGRMEPIKIDYLFTNANFRDTRQIHWEPDYISDHDPVVTTLVF